MSEWEMATGDLSSKEMGSGARANGNKPKWELMSFSQIYLLMLDENATLMLADVIEDQDMFAHLAGFQAGETVAMDLLRASVAYNWAKQGGPDKVTLLSSLENVIRVWDFGLRKYAPFNWAKGMNWQTCFGCIARHVKYHYECSDIDDESGELHSAHVVCNAMMLMHYEQYWKEGDDRPLFAFPNQEPSEGSE